MTIDGQERPRQATCRRVLVVDDEEWMRDAVGQILQPEGFEVITASDGPSGLELAKRHSPDLILVDLKMPGMDGIAYVESVKALDAEVVAVVISGYATLEKAVEAMKAGAYDFLPKPFKPEDLRGVVRRGIEHRSAALRASAAIQGKAPAAELHLAMLAHRFKEPLATLRTCVSVVLQGYAGDISPQARQMIEVAAQRADQMIHFVDDWLTLARLEQGKGIQEPKAVDLVELAKAAVERTRQQPHAAQLDVQLVIGNHPEILLGDSSALDELLTNLLDNAVRYTPAGGTVTVEVGTLGDAASIKVCDTGPGVPPDEAQRIFEPFFRGQAQKHIPGTGLGLPIVKRIAEAHGGRVELQPAAGQGATFCVVFQRGGADGPIVRRRDGSGRRRHGAAKCLDRNGVNDADHKRA